MILVVELPGYCVSVWDVVMDAREAEDMAREVSETYESGGCPVSWRLYDDDDACVEEGVVGDGTAAPQ